MGWLWAILLAGQASAQERVTFADEARAMALMVEGDKLMAAGRFEDAARTFEAAWQLTRRPTLLARAAIAHHGAGEEAAAEEALARYRARAPLAPVPAYARASVLVEVPEPTAHRAPTPWVFAAIGSSLAVIGGAMAATAYDPERPFDTVGLSTAAIGATVALGGTTWGVTRELAR